METSSKHTIVSGLFWTYMERITAQVVSLLVSIVLARMLDPEHYGVISIVMIFITLCNAFVTGGFGNSLVQKKDSDDLDFNTMLITSVVCSVVLYLLLFFTAPLISSFYDMPLLTPVIRVLGLRVPVSGINSIQHAKVQKEMKFKKFFWATLFGTVLSAFVGIWMASKGFGVWALVGQYLTNTTVDTIVLFFTIRWNIRFEFSFDRAKRLLKYGWKVLVTSIVFTMEADIRSLIVGKVFGPADLAYYDQGKKYPNLIVTNLNSSISKVMFPVLSNAQDDLLRLKSLCRKAIRMGLFVIGPLLFGLIAIADTFVNVLLTEKWDSCVPFLRILTIVFLCRPFTTTCQQAINAIGRSDITLRIEIIINVFGLSAIAFAVFVIGNVIWIAWVTVITELLSVALYLYYSRVLIDYRFSEQLTDFIPTLFACALMGVIVYFVGFLPINRIILLILQLLVGILSYLTITLYMKNPSLLSLLKFIKKKTKSSFVGAIIRSRYGEL